MTAPRTPLLGGPLWWSLLGNVPVMALGLLLVLHVQARTGEFGSAGLATAGFAVGLAVSGPVIGRAVDRRGQVAVVAPLAAVTVALIAAIGLLPGDASPGLIALLATLAGLAAPPSGSLVRAIWSTSNLDDAVRHRLLAVHAAGIEVTYILGPVVFVGGLATLGTDVALFAAAALLAVATAGYLVSPEVRGWRGSAERPAGLAGPLAAPAVRVLLTVGALTGVGLGAIELGVAATADAAGRTQVAGLLLGAWGVGSMVGALLVARLPPPADQPRALWRRLVVLAVADLLLLLTAEPLLLAPLLFVAGAALSPSFVAELAELGDAAPPGTAAEVFAWSSAATGGGFALGAAVCGPLADAATWAPFLLAAAISAAAALTAFAGVGVLHRARREGA